MSATLALVDEDSRRHKRSNLLIYESMEKAFLGHCIWDSSEIWQNQVEEGIGVWRWEKKLPATLYFVWSWFAVLVDQYFPRLLFPSWPPQLHTPHWGGDRWLQPGNNPCFQRVANTSLALGIRQVFSFKSKPYGFLASMSGEQKFDASYRINSHFFLYFCMKIILINLFWLRKFL